MATCTQCHREVDCTVSLTLDIGDGEKQRTPAVCFDCFDRLLDDDTPSAKRYRDRLYQMERDSDIHARPDR